MKARSVGLWFVWLALAGCDGFDPALYQRAQAASASDACRQDEPPVLASSTEFAQLDLAQLDDSWQVDNCAHGGASGNDAFFAVEMEQGQKFHFHVNALDAIDPVLYVVDSCDERVCQPLHAASACASDKEHLSFLAPRAGRYYVGVDSVDPGGGRVEVLAISPTCGDGEKQHSEACDDGNLEPGDGCDARCRFELPESGRAALEPNDGLADGNVLALSAPPSSFRIRGTLEGSCDPEVFTFSLPAQTQVAIRMLDETGEACAALHPEVSVDMQLFSGQVSIAQGRPQDDNACPVIATVSLPAADDTAHLPSSSTTHHVQLSTRGPADAPPLAFTLDIELGAP